jgi:5-methylcytosine-specific restriction endonuclease McrA
MSRRKRAPKLTKTGKPKKRPKYNQSSAIRSALRRSFSRSPIVREIMQAHRRELPKYNKDGSLAAKPKVEYQCQVCAAWVSSTKIAVDHILPVIPMANQEKEQWDPQNPDWNMYVRRLWCDPSNLQTICSDCHDKKTAAERQQRKMS